MAKERQRKLKTEEKGSASLSMKVGCYKLYFHNKSFLLIVATQYYSSLWQLRNPRPKAFIVGLNNIYETHFSIGRIDRHFISMSNVR